jgi:hypothetical protein
MMQIGGIEGWIRVRPPLNYMVAFTASLAHEPVVNFFIVVAWVKKVVERNCAMTPRCSEAMLALDD